MIVDWYILVEYSEKEVSKLFMFRLLPFLDFALDFVEVNQKEDIQSLYLRYHAVVAI
jgi:hypothetical protein